MGRDKTAGKRMAAKRMREKEAGLRRLNVAVKPEVIENLADLMKRHNCSSQATTIEFLVLSAFKAAESGAIKKNRNAVTSKKLYLAIEAASIQEEEKTKDAPLSIQLTLF
ncbi:MAG: hypothetical protein PHN84_08435 [Desulfuromonadaceae bacterium]|nr:hypothetical protein [Desulfuromonadaceae bacterium]